MYFSEFETFARKRPDLAGLVQRLDALLGPKLKMGDVVDSASAAGLLNESMQRLDRLFELLVSHGAMKREDYVKCVYSECSVMATLESYRAEVDTHGEYECTGCGQDLVEQIPRVVRVYRVTVSPAVKSEEPRTMTAGQKLTVLFMSASPVAETRLRVDAECRDIEEKIRSSDMRDRIVVKQANAARPDDLIGALLREKPNVLHFSGHGSEAEELVMEDSGGRTATVSKEDLVQVFRAVGGEFRGVVLNACFSRAQALALVEVVDFAIGMRASIGDKAARVFAAAFYRGLAYGQTLKQAFDQGVLSMRLEKTGHHELPELVTRERLDSSKLKLLAD